MAQATVEKRAEAMRHLRETVKARKIRYADIAFYSGNSAGWVGVVLRGGYPWRDEYLLPKNVRLALETLAISVPTCLVTF